MKENVEFLVFRSSVHAYGRFISGLGLPLVALWLFCEMEDAFIIPILTIIVSVFLFMSLNTKLVIDRNGICISHFFRKKYRILWNEVVCAGIAGTTIMGIQGKIQILYFASRPISLAMMFNGQTFPALSERFLFATLQPGLIDAIEEYWGAENARRFFDGNERIEKQVQLLSAENIHSLIYFELAAFLLSLICFLYTRKTEWIYAIGVFLMCIIVGLVKIKKSHH